MRDLEKKRLTDARSRKRRAGHIAAYMKEYRQRPGVRERLLRNARANHIRRAYGLAVAQYEQVFEDSDGLCAICYERPATHLDHDPASGKPRGALCSQHNRALGMFGDSEEGLLSALEYLRTAP